MKTHPCEKNWCNSKKKNYEFSSYYYENVTETVLDQL